MIDREFDPFRREDGAEEARKVAESLTALLVFVGGAAQMAMAAEKQVAVGDIEGAMQLVQRIRYKLQFKAEDLAILLGDMHFVATGDDDFDLEEWFDATGEHDYNALDLVTDLRREIGYMSGSDLEGDSDE